MFYSLLVFFTPLIFIQNTNELFEFPKMLFVYVIGFFVIAFFLTDIFIKPVKLKKPHYLVSILLLLSFISLIFSSHFYTSIVGYYSRFNDSFLSHLVFFGLYFVGINKLQKNDLEKILKISLFTIFPMSFFALSQHFSGTARAFSTIGQPNWLAQYLSLLLPIVVYFLLTEDVDKFKIWFAIYVFGFYSLWVTYSVSGVFSFFIGLTFLLLKIIRGKGQFSELKTRLFFLLTITLFVSISNLGMFKDKIKDVFVDIKKQSYVVKKVYAQKNENIISDPGFIRVELWKSTLNLIFSKPKVFLIGTGLETFPYSFQPFRNLKLNYSSEWDFVFNKPHNFYLEIFAESGVFSLLFALLLLFSLYKKTSAYISSSIVAFMISNFFGWPTVSTSLIFCLFLIFFGGAFDDKKKSKNTLWLNKKPIMTTLIVIVWSTYLIFLYKISNFYRADVYYVKSQKLVEQGKEEDALFYSNKALDNVTFEPNYYRGRAKINTVFLVTAEDKDSVKEEIFSDIKKAEELNPQNLVTVRNSIPIYYFLGVGDIFSGAGEGNYDSKYVDDVSSFFNETKKDYWNDAGVVLAVAKYEKKLGLKEDYDISVERIRELRPDLLEWHELFR